MQRLGSIEIVCWKSNYLQGDSIYWYVPYDRQNFAPFSSLGTILYKKRNEDMVYGHAKYYGMVIYIQSNCQLE